MTTTADGLDEGADFHESGALDPFKSLRELLPRLAQPFWYRHAHSGIWTDEKEAKAIEHGAAIAKAKRRDEKKRSRLARALAGEHTRACARAAA